MANTLEEIESAEFKIAVAALRRRLDLTERQLVSAPASAVLGAKSGHEAGALPQLKRGQNRQHVGLIVPDPCGWKSAFQLGLRGLQVLKRWFSGFRTWLISQFGTQRTKY